MERNIINQLKFARNKKRNCVLSWVQVTYLLDWLEELGVDVYTIDLR